MSTLMRVDWARLSVSYGSAMIPETCARCSLQNSESTLFVSYYRSETESAHVGWVLPWSGFTPPVLQFSAYQYIYIFNNKQENINIKKFNLEEV
eukprot:3121558-Amphidinium_carterae.1